MILTYNLQIVLCAFWEGGGGEIECKRTEESALV